MSSLSSLGSSSGTTSASSSGGTASTSSSSGSSSGSPLNINGLVTGLNTSAIVQAELSLQQQQINTVTAEQTAAQQKETAYQALQAQLVTLQSNIAQLAQTFNGPFSGRTATSSNPSVVTAAGSSTATPGVYSVTVNGLAQANEIASQGFASPTSQITTGTLTIGSGSSSATITIGSTNDTLQGLAAAIDNANVGVNASIINTGAPGQPYRLLLSATQTGTANAITLASSLGPSSPTAVQPQFSQNAVGAAVAAASNTGSAAATSSGTYTGSANTTYTLTVTNPGTVDSGTVTLSVKDSAGDTLSPITITGTNTPATIADGVTVQFGSGTLAQGDQFTIDATVPTVQAAANSSVTLGSGPGALTVNSASNTVTTAIGGVTLNLQTAAPGQPVQITVANDTGTAQTAIQNFVSDYNSVISTIANDTSYDPTTKTAGVLLGDSSILNIENQLTSLVTEPVTGVNPKLNNLAALGITSDSTGQLQIDSTALNKVLSGQVSGVTLNDVQALFAQAGQSTNASVTFVNATSATKASATPFGVVVTQAATQAVLTAGAALSASPQVTSGSNSFTLTANGLTSNTIAIPTGTYSTPQLLVQTIQTQIDADSHIGNQNVIVGLNNSNQLTFTSGTYGQASTLSIAPAGFLGFNSAASAAGQDVAGSFLVNGQSEAATGNGQILTGNSGNANSDGLAVQVSLLPSQVSANSSTPVANVTVTQGVAAQLNNALNGLLDPTTGQLQTINQNFQDQIASYQTQINLLQQEYNLRAAQLTEEFVQLEQTVSNLKNASSLLNSQTAALQSLSGTTTTGSSVQTPSASTSSSSG